MLEAVLTREDGMSSIPVKISLTVTAPGTKYNPLYTSPYEGTDRTLNGWTVPMDITDGEAVWQALMAPVTVVDDGKSTDQRRSGRIPRRTAKAWAWSR